MTVNLFTTPLDAITASDVQDFLDLNIEEGPRLEYKQANSSTKGIPDRALMTIIAFANTYGGLLILGVDVDRATNRPSARDGLQFNSQASFEEQLTSRCYGSIQPPIVPEIRVCPFKSASTELIDDRAFVIVRIAPSAAAPHATKENQVYVRVGSESRLADLLTLRALFERHQQREQRLAELAATVRHRGETVFTRFTPEWQDDMPYSARWQRRWPAIVAEFIPLDVLTTLLSFVPTGLGGPSPDDHIKLLLRSEGWTLAHDVTRDKPDDMVREPEGLGVVAPFTANILTYEEDVFRSLAPTTWYIDHSGSALLVLPEASLQWPSTVVLQAQMPNEPPQITPLLYQLRCATRVLWSLFREQGYAGRVEVFVWYWQGQPEAFDYGIERGHHGRVVLALEDQWETRAQNLANLVSQLTRSWLNFPFRLQKWPEFDLPVLG